MANMTECPWTRRICQELKSMAGVAVFTNQRPYIVSGKAKLAQPSNLGWPDRYIAHPLYSGWIEFKGDKTRLSDLQRKVIGDLRYRWPGGAWIVRKHDTGIVLQDENESDWAYAEDHGLSLLLALFQLGLMPAAWVEDRQAKLRETLGVVVERLRALGFDGSVIDMRQ
jgi:hypothetical protein